MKDVKIVNSVKSSIGKMGFKLKKHSPEILIVAGVVGTVVSTVMACKATTKVSEILENTKSDIKSIHDCQSNTALAEQYTEKDAKKDLTIVYAQTGLKFVKLYAPAVALGVLSISSMLISNNILRKRNMALAAAYATVNKSFKEYRENVVNRFGGQVDKELKYNLKAKKVGGTEIDPETGKEKKITKTINVTNGLSDYACVFDKSSSYWDDVMDYNAMFLKAQQSHANNKLKANGYLFLNDVLDGLDIPRTKAGQIVGWVYDPKNPNGDNFVDFGMFETYIEDGYGELEPVVVLDFNVDGNVLDLM